MPSIVRGASVTAASYDSVMSAASSTSPPLNIGTGRYEMNTQHYRVYALPSGSVVGVDLADASAVENGKEIIIKDINGTGGDNSFTIYPSGGQTIDGNANYTIDNWECVRLKEQSNNWIII